MIWSLSRGREIVQGKEPFTALEQFHFAETVGLVVDSTGAQSTAGLGKQHVAFEKEELQRSRLRVLRHSCRRVAEVHAERRHPFRDEEKPALPFSSLAECMVAQ